ncbi:pleckstrin homology-like domain family A member 2 [Anolis carolinensis]|uniref:pleckstrin homology-like domain family A member 2 n=1 Tax=Anolis carolinensis TaxID=28377 RepID=UPI0002038061|nr:PREDICTED: pleckstrin homology-like domain family A member 2 [Anolis carolinensis]|eukprot:XP_003214865.1 PREDICTED: pleckstrin homology-like domain family A member 2 [Anolis carolinensis]
MKDSCASPSSSSSAVLRAGELEKRSASLLQLWKKKRAELRADGLSLFSPEGGKGAAGGGLGGGRKELRFGAIQKVDCVERTGKYVYFTIVTTDRREIDFRCPGESCWNASITLALIDFQNKRALRDFHSRRQKEEEEEEEQATARAPHAKPPTRRPRLARAS